MPFQRIKRDSEPGLTKLTVMSFLLIIISLIPALVFAANPKNELKCMALNLYFEARGESQRGQIAVGMVTLNRSLSRQFGPTICKVVYARGQFSWTFDPYSNVPKPGAVWDNIMKLSKNILHGVYTDETHMASHYYNPRGASPNWARVFTRTAIIGQHHFYRMPGYKLVYSKEDLAWLMDENVDSMQGLFGAYNFEEDEANIEMSKFAHPLFQSKAEFDQYIENLPDSQVNSN